MMKRLWPSILLTIWCLLAPENIFSQNDGELQLLDAVDVDNAPAAQEQESSSDSDENTTETGGQLNLSEFEEANDLKSLEGSAQEATPNIPPPLPSAATPTLPTTPPPSPPPSQTSQSQAPAEQSANRNTEIFEVGEEEEKLLELSKFVEKKIPDKDWDEVAASAQIDKYIVQKGDWLWKIAQKLFGSGFYYSKIWSLNPQIGNPHEIEPGMTLVFSTGDTDEMPEVQVSNFDVQTAEDTEEEDRSRDYTDLNNFGDDVRPPWLSQRQQLIDSGVYFQYASEETFDDLKKSAEERLTTEYNKYEPPPSEAIILEPDEGYDESGFDRSSRVMFDFKEGFSLNTFVTSNIVQDLGYIAGARQENVFIQQFSKIYVAFDKSVNVKPGDMYSVYIPGGTISHRVSDRSGRKYTIGAQIKAIRKIDQQWECSVIELTGTVQRNDRITVYTPRIGRILKTFNKRNIEAAAVGTYKEGVQYPSFGSVLYLDRGRADGVEIGTIFEAYSFLDRGTERRLTPNPTYKIGELTVISLTDNFSTALVTQSSEPIILGTITITKTEEQALIDNQVKDQKGLQKIEQLEREALDELDVALDLDDINEDLLKKADQIQLNEDELEELERQEREKSIIQDHEKDLKELERLEKEILDAELVLNQSKVDEDKFLEQQDLEQVEKTIQKPNPDAFESLNDIEKEVGVKFMDEDLNSKENPYGLTEFDLEEIDELLNTEQ